MAPGALTAHPCVTVTTGYRAALERNHLERTHFAARAVCPPLDYARYRDDTADMKVEVIQQPTGRVG
jgi:hypothetical protein